MSQTMSKIGQNTMMIVHLTMKNNRRNGSVSSILHPSSLCAFISLPALVRKSQPPFFLNPFDPIVIHYLVWFIRIMCAWRGCFRTSVVADGVVWLRFPSEGCLIRTTTRVRHASANLVVQSFCKTGRRDVLVPIKGREPSHYFLGGDVRVELPKVM